MNNEFSIPLRQVPPGPLSDVHIAEKKRFSDEYENVKKSLPAVQQVGILQDEEKNRVAKHDGIATEYAAFRSVKDELKKTIDMLKPMRAKTSPQSDIEQEKQNIFAIVAVQMYVIQCILLTILFCMLVYVVIPVEYAHGVAFLVACTGSAIGIYLSGI
jgi:hypothetical protein